MKTKLALTLLALAAVSLNLQAATSALPAPLPELMNDEQAAKWSAAQEAAATTASANEPSNQFYTGKPYVADAGGYVYKYRTYSPEMSRWTSADPSGFPDGVNNHLYCNEPISMCDNNGLNAISASSNYPIGLTVANFITAGTTAVNTLNGGNTSSFITYLSGQVTADLGSINVATLSEQITGSATYSSGSWSNPGIVPATGATASYNLNATVSGIGLTGTLSYSVSYTLSGEASLQSQTNTSATVQGNIIPEVTVSIAFNLSPGIGYSASGPGQGTVFQVDINLNE